MTTQDNSLENVALVLTAVDEQRDRLLNVLSVLQCVRTTADGGGTDEVAGSLALLEEEMQRVVTSLEEPQLLKAAAAREAVLREAADGRAAARARDAQP